MEVLATLLFRALRRLLLLPMLPPPGVLAGVILWSGLRAMGLRTEKNPPSNTFSASSAAAPSVSTAPTAALSSRLPLLSLAAATSGVFFLLAASATAESSSSLAFAAISLRLAAIMAFSPFDAPPPAAGAIAFLLTAAAAGFLGLAFSFAAVVAVVALFHPFASSRVSSP